MNLLQHFMLIKISLNLASSSCFISRHLPIQHSEVPTNDGASVPMKWNPSESLNNLILCCSVLTVGEKVTVEFRFLFLFFHKDVC